MTDTNKITIKANSFELEVARLTNLERTRRGIPALTLSSILFTAARAKSQDMKNNRLLSHNSPRYGMFPGILKSYRINLNAYLGENIYGTVSGATSAPQRAVAWWMASPRHREAILSRDYTHLGVGYVSGNGTWWTQEFWGPNRG
ncbi:CAP domain-containing protein [Paenibacillus lignilyticus]|uniref:SCP domain-containing protein n=1 Tax=Paenibacillus lignilyticus TaxID=1172615 RepID=A0ABS5C7R0_9BACL|nr:CAP domain-containing protein [Paenibacillus lignilyticus]MBP3961990.1 hypothetical protein [Paenibacillus lignilyticus]